MEEDEEANDRAQPSAPARRELDLYDPLSILPRIGLAADELRVSDAIDLGKEFEAFMVAEQTALRLSTRRLRSVDSNGRDEQEAAAQPEKKAVDDARCSEVARSSGGDAVEHPAATAKRSALRLAYEYPVPMPPEDVAAARRRDLLRRTDPIRAHLVEQVLEGSRRNPTAAESLRQEYARAVDASFRPDERAYHDALVRQLQHSSSRIARLRESLHGEGNNPGSALAPAPDTLASVERTSGESGGGNGPSSLRRFETNSDALTSLRAGVATASHTRGHVATMDLAWAAFMANLERRKGAIDLRSLDEYFPR
jgi:hypothetical protein